MKKYFFLFLVITSCASVQNIDAEKAQITTTLDNWHKAAANADYNSYFDAMTENSIFIGTDATENWNKEAFQKFAKPYLGKVKARKFTEIERIIDVSKSVKRTW